MVSWWSRYERSSVSISRVYQTRAYDNYYEVIENMISKELVVVEGHAMFELLFVTTKDMRDSRDWHIVLRLEITFRGVKIRFVQNVQFRPKRIHPKQLFVQNVLNQKKKLHQESESSIFHPKLIHPPGLLLCFWFWWVWPPHGPQKTNFHD